MYVYNCKQLKCIIVLFIIKTVSKTVFLLLQINIILLVESLFFAPHSLIYDKEMSFAKVYAAGSNTSDSVDILKTYF